MKTIDPLFATRTPREGDSNHIQAVRESFDTLLSNLRAHCPGGRELAIAKTKLEEACFFAVKAITHADSKEPVAQSEAKAKPGPVTFSGCSGDGRGDEALDQDGQQCALCARLGVK